MGIFRFFLAFTILIGHAHEGRYIPEYIFPYVQAAGYYGAAKMHCFFLISGFFTEYLLNDRLKNSKHYIRDFYFTRLMRLLPGYFLILALTYWFVFLAPQYGFTPVRANTIPIEFYHHKFRQEGWLYILYNLFAVVPETYRLYDFAHAKSILYLLVTQAWSLSVEYACLVIAPFLFRNKNVFVVALFLSALIAIFLATKGIYRNYVLSTLIFYLCGSLAYRAYEKFLSKYEAGFRSKTLIIAILVVLTGYLLWFGFIGGAIGFPIAYMIFMLFAFVSLPVLFVGSKSFLRDRWIGDLAYPMYLNHALLLMMFGSYKMDPHATWWLLPAGSVVLAIFMMHFIDQPLQYLRRKYYYR